MKYKTKNLKPGMNWIIDNSFPKELEVGETYRISFDFKPTTDKEGFADNISVKQISLPETVVIEKLAKKHDRQGKTGSRQRIY